MGLGVQPSPGLSANEAASALQQTVEPANERGQASGAIALEPVSSTSVLAQRAGAGRNESARGHAAMGALAPIMERSPSAALLEQRVKLVGNPDKLSLPEFQKKMFLLEGMALTEAGRLGHPGGYPFRDRNELYAFINHDLPESQQLPVLKVPLDDLSDPRLTAMHQTTADYLLFMQLANPFSAQEGLEARYAKNALTQLMADIRHIEPGLKDQLTATSSETTALRHDLENMQKAAEADGPEGASEAGLAEVAQQVHTAQQTVEELSQFIHTYRADALDYILKLDRDQELQALRGSGMNWARALYGAAISQALLSTGHFGAVNTLMNWGFDKLPDHQLGTALKIVVTGTVLATAHEALNQGGRPFTQWFSEKVGGLPLMNVSDVRTHPNRPALVVEQGQARLLDEQELAQQAGEVATKRNNFKDQGKLFKGTGTMSAEALVFLAFGFAQFMGTMLRLAAVGERVFRSSGGGFNMGVLQTGAQALQKDEGQPLTHPGRATSTFAKAATNSRAMLIKMIDVGDREKRDILLMKVFGAMTGEALNGLALAAAERIDSGGLGRHVASSVIPDWVQR